MFLIVYRADLNECQQERRMVKSKPDQPLVVASELCDFPQTSCTITRTSSTPTCLSFGTARTFAIATASL